VTLPFFATGHEKSIIKVIEKLLPAQKYFYVIPLILVPSSDSVHLSQKSYIVWIQTVHIIYDHNKPVPENLHLIESKEFKYVDSGESIHATPIIFLHGLLGNPEGWYDAASSIVDHGYRALVPRIPIDSMPQRDANVQGIANYVHSFAHYLNLDQIVLVGNSLGGQIAVRYVSDHPMSVVALLLSGSSGIYETEIGTSTFRRRDRNFIRQQAEKSFYNPAMVNDGLIDRIFKITANRFHALRIVWTARSSMNDLIVDELQDLDLPTYLIWGTYDQITPPYVGHEFQKLLPNAQLHFIDECGHAPMMEYPNVFNELMINFLNCVFKNSGVPA